jgi:acylaminoacyl-peptidase
VAKRILVSSPDIGGGRVLLTAFSRSVSPGPFDLTAKASPDGARVASISRRGLGEGAGHRAVGLRVGWEPEKSAKFLGVPDFGRGPGGDAMAMVAYEGALENDVKHVERLLVRINDFGFAYNVASHLYIVDTLSGVRVLRAGWNVSFLLSGLPGDLDPG